MNSYQNWGDEFEESLREIPFHEGETQLKEVYEAEDTMIGRGAFGYVKCGIRKADHCSVAIKVIPSALVNEWYYSKTLQRNIPLEVLLLTLTKQIKGVVQIMEYYEDAQQLQWYIVMERYTKTKDLFEYINANGCLSEEVACNILYQLLVIIIDCHVLGVVHRDIKEENILIDANTKKIWLIDFGSGCLMKDDRHVTYNGTLEYSPPEWLRYQHYRGCQLESWTLGIVLYAMLCGSIPFEDEEQILSGIVRFPRKLSKSCVELIHRCLEIDPEARIQPFEMITHTWVTSTLSDCDSGRSSFDEAFINLPRSRKCSCSCGENLPTQNREEEQEEEGNNESVIETISYNNECYKQIDLGAQFRVISKSLSLDVEKSEFITEMIQSTNIHRSTSALNCMDCQSELSLDKIATIFGGDDNGYDEDIDDNFQLDEESLIISNEDIF